MQIRLSPELEECARSASTPMSVDEFLAHVRRNFLVGDQVTFWTGWQEGALLSALDAVRSIDRKVNPTATRP